MARFVNIYGTQINVDSIQTFRTIGDKNLRITFKNGEGEMFKSGNAYADEDILRGKNHVIQVIPTKEPLYAVWEDGEGHYTEPVNYLALCADGELLALDLSDGYFDVLDADSTYKGIYHEEEMLKLTGKR